jgi:hypothetical protein
MTPSPNEIIATETGPIKAAVILAALRAAGWEVVRAEEEPRTDWGAHWKELQRRAKIDPIQYT